MDYQRQTKAALTTSIFNVASVLFERRITENILTKKAISKKEIGAESIYPM